MNYYKIFIKKLRCFYFGHLSVRIMKNELKPIPPPLLSDEKIKNMSDIQKLRYTDLLIRPPAYVHTYYVNTCSICGKETRED